jgi:UDP-N-acetyl-D-galactosamine dehydrogenase
VSAADFASADQLQVTSDPGCLGEADFVIVAVPTPVDEAHQPDLSPLVGASISVAKSMAEAIELAKEGLHVWRL